MCVVTESREGSSGVFLSAISLEVVPGQVVKFLVETGDQTPGGSWHETTIFA